MTETFADYLKEHLDDIDEKTSGEIASYNEALESFENAYGAEFPYRQDAVIPCKGGHMHPVLVVDLKAFQRLLDALSFSDIELMYDVRKINDNVQAIVDELRERGNG